ncbi:MAG: host-nuclease inhibitor Gam family protein [Magnetococcales bacterium]|nr:host-nuclease inhibitor Gam family protein [Magnetococcales bacterium]
MARTKPEIFYIRDLDHANQVMAEMSQISREIQRIETDLNREIDAAKALADALAAPHRKKLEAMGNGLANYAEHNKKELFVAKKTVDLVFGMFGFRLSYELAPAVKSTWGAVLERLKAMKIHEAIRVREDPAKDIMREWSDERLASVGARRVEKDQFWYELKEVNLEN